MKKNNQEEVNILSFNYLIDIIKKKWLTFISIIILFLIFASYNAFLKKNIYEVKFNLAPFLTDINNSENFIIESSTLEVIVNNFCIKYKNLKEDLKHEEKLYNATNLKSFHNLSVTPSISESGDKKGKSVEISLFVYDTTATQAIIKDLITYINQNVMIKNLLKEKEIFLINEKEKLENGLKEMILYREDFQKNNSKINVVNFNIYRDIIQTQKEIANVAFQLKNLKAIEIVADAENPNKPIGLSPIKGFILITLFGIFTALCFVIIMDKLTKNQNC